MDTFSCPNRGLLTDLKFVGMVPSNETMSSVDALGEDTSSTNFVTEDFEVNHCGPYTEFEPIKNCTEKYLN